MQAKLTKSAVERIAPGPKDVFVWDTEQKGFGVKVTPAGRRIYIVQYWKPGVNRAARVTLGAHGDLTLDEARRQASKVRGAVAGGGDPAADKRRAREAAQAAVAEADRYAFETVLREWVEKDQKPRNKTWHEAQRRLENHVLPRWRGRDVREFTRRDVVQLLDALQTEGGLGVGANRVLAALRRLFKWAAAREIVKVSPVLPVAPPVDEKKRKRERVLATAEIRAVWQGAERLGGPFGALVRFLLVTGQRRSEAAGIEESHLDREAAVWRLPAGANKAGRSHDVPLSALALEILQAAELARVQPSHRRRKARPADQVAANEAEPLEPGGPFLFSTTAGRRPVSGFSKAKLQLDDTIAELVKTGGLPSAPKPWTLHDLRRTAATGMAEAGVAPSTLSRVLNHAEGGVTKIYNRHSYLAEKRAALDLWAGVIRGIVDPEAGEVVPLRTVAGTALSQKAQEVDNA